MSKMFTIDRSDNERGHSTTNRYTMRRNQSHSYGTQLNRYDVNSVQTMQHNRRSSNETQDDEIRITPIQTSNLRYQTDSQTTKAKTKSNKIANIRQIQDGIVGLKNNNLYCYMNACLQCLLPIEEFRDYYLNQEFKKFQDVQTLNNTDEYSQMMSQFINDAFDIDSRK